MKHLKRFNESESLRKILIKKFIEEKEKVDKLVSEYLAYLTDAGYHIRLQEARLVSNTDNTVSPIHKFITVNIRNFNNEPTQLFKWEDIKYDFIPFLEELPKYFTIKKIEFSSSNTYECSLDDLIEDKKEVTDDYKNLRYILIYI